MRQSQQNVVREIADVRTQIAELLAGGDITADISADHVDQIGSVPDFTALQTGTMRTGYIGWARLAAATASRSPN